MSQSLSGYHPFISEGYPSVQPSPTTTFDHGMSLGAPSILFNPSMLSSNHNFSYQHKNRSFGSGSVTETNQFMTHTVLVDAYAQVPHHICPKMLHFISQSPTRGAAHVIMSLPMINQHMRTQTWRNKYGNSRTMDKFFDDWQLYGGIKGEINEYLTTNRAGATLSVVVGGRFRMIQINQSIPLATIKHGAVKKGDRIFIYGVRRKWKDPLKELAMTQQQQQHSSSLSSLYDQDVIPLNPKPSLFQPFSGSLSDTAVKGNNSNNPKARINGMITVFYCFIMIMAKVRTLQYMKLFDIDKSNAAYQLIKRIRIFINQALNQSLTTGVGGQGVGGTPFKESLKDNVNSKIVLGRMNEIEVYTRYLWAFNSKCILSDDKKEKQWNLGGLFGYLNRELGKILVDEDKMDITTFEETYDDFAKLSIDASSFSQISNEHINIMNYFMFAYIKYFKNIINMECSISLDDMITKGLKSLDNKGSIANAMQTIVNKRIELFKPDDPIYNILFPIFQVENEEKFTGNSKLEKAFENMTDHINGYDVSESKENASNTRSSKEKISSEDPGDETDDDPVVRSRSAPGAAASRTSGTGAGMGVSPSTTPSQTIGDDDNDTTSSTTRTKAKQKTPRTTRTQTTSTPLTDNNNSSDIPANGAGAASSSSSSSGSDDSIMNQCNLLYGTITKPSNPIKSNSSERLSPPKPSTSSSGNKRKSPTISSNITQLSYEYYWQFHVYVSSDKCPPPFYLMQGYDEETNETWHGSSLYIGFVDHVHGKRENDKIDMCREGLFPLQDNSEHMKLLQYVDDMDIMIGVH